MFSAHAEKEKVGVYMYLCSVQGLEKLTTRPMIIRYCPNTQGGSRYCESLTTRHIMAQGKNLTI